MRVEKIPVYTLLAGLGLYLIQYIVPSDYLQKIINSGLNFTGYITMVIFPILGILGAAVSIYKRKWALLILNIFMIFSFYILFVVSVLIYGFV